MSHRLISRSQDLKRLQDEGYTVAVKAGFLLIDDIPYVTIGQTVAYGTLVAALTLQGDVTVRPGTHVVYFRGSIPCDRHGQPLSQIINTSQSQKLADDLEIDHTFSSKPSTGGYMDYYDQMTTYAAILASHAHALDSNATATPFRVIEAQDEESVFRYVDTASSRAGIDVMNDRLGLGRIAIVGLGGTGAYILDLVAKSPVKEIHLYDGDRFAQHNAFRSPGAASMEDLYRAQRKASYFSDIYAKMRRNIIPHDVYVSESNIDELRSMAFVFLSLDRGDAKRLLIGKLEEYGVPFIDVGMGVYETNGAVAGLLRVTTSTSAQREHVHTHGRIPFSDGNLNNDYARNIQIADLNALNAALAVIRWKKMCGFYLDPEGERHSVYQIDGNIITNEDHALCE
jgi:hypothetical protein